MEIRVNGRTGQIAIPQGTDPRASNIHIYEPGDYKINRMKGQVAVRTPEGWQVHDLTPDQANALSTPEAIGLQMSGGKFGPGAGANEHQTSGTESGLLGLQQGVTLNTADEIGGGMAAALATLNGDQAPVDPAHPVTGGLSSGFGANYQNQVGQARTIFKDAQASNPKIFKGARFAGSILPSAALPATSLPAAAGFGAVQGGIQGAGGADTANWKDMLMSSALGAAGGAAGGTLGWAGGKILAANTPSGMAYNAIDQASPNGIKALAEDTATAGGSAAEQSPVLADTLRNFSEQAPKQAAAAVGPAATRMGAVNDQAVQGVDALLSPQNAVLYLKQVKDAARAANGPAYEAAYASPVRVGLPMEVQNQPVFREALDAAQEAASNELPPRQIDAGNLSAKDIDLVDRMLRTMKTAAEKSQGDTSEAAIKAQATLPAVAQRLTDTRYVADQAFPELATARAGATTALETQGALKLGANALAPGREAVEIAAEYNALAPHEQEAYRVGIATKLRAMLATKGSAANVGQVFDKTGLAEKLVAVGFPQATVDKIVKGGMSARAVLNALQGGSDTAQKLLAEKAGKSPMSQVTARDLILGALTNVPTMGGVKLMNVVGGAAERGAAKRVVEALASQDPKALQGLLKIAPQASAPLFNILSRSAGAQQGTSLFPSGGRQ